MTTPTPEPGTPDPEQVAAHLEKNADELDALKFPPEHEEGKSSLVSKFRELAADIRGTL
jgi:hypothetical protein